MPNAIRVAPGVVKIELAIASDGPGAIPLASCWSVLPCGAGNSVLLAAEASLTRSRMPFSLGTLRTGSGDAASWLPPPQAVANRASEAAIDATTRYMAKLG